VKKAEPTARQQYFAIALCGLCYWPSKCRTVFVLTCLLVNVASSCFLCRLVNPVSAVTSAWYSNAAYHNQDLQLVTQVVCQGMQHFESYTWSDGSV